MIELPEARVIGEQMRKELAGARIVRGDRGNAVHKFAFATGSAEEYAAILAGRTLGAARGHGSAILVPVEPGYVLGLGGGGERILLHRDPTSVPRSYHLRLDLEGGACLTVTVQGWGSTLLLAEDRAAAHPHMGTGRVPPLSDGFTLDHFLGLLGRVPPEAPTSLKAFLISTPGVWGVGNGCLQEILFQARLHPKRRAVDTDEGQQRRLYAAIQAVLGEMVELGGRDGEVDLYGCAGRYRRRLHSKSVGQPCPVCGTPIVGFAYLGGNCYACPTCQG